MSGLDWPGLMRAGMGQKATGGLGLTPDVFWRLTPMELALMQGGGVVKPMSRNDLAGLLRDWPDVEGQERGGSNA